MSVASPFSRGVCAEVVGIYGPPQAETRRPRARLDAVLPTVEASPFEPHPPPAPSQPVPPQPVPPHPAPKSSGRVVFAPPVPEAPAVPDAPPAADPGSRGVGIALRLALAAVPLCLLTLVVLGTLMSDAPVRPLPSGAAWLLALGAPRLDLAWLRAGGLAALLWTASALGAAAIVRVGSGPSSASGPVAPAFVAPTFVAVALLTDVSLLLAPAPDPRLLALPVELAALLLFALAAAHANGRPGVLLCAGALFALAAVLSGRVPVACPFALLAVPVLWREGRARLRAGASLLVGAAAGAVLLFRLGADLRPVLAFDVPDPAALLALRPSAHDAVVVAAVAALALLRFRARRRAAALGGGANALATGPNLVALALAALVAWAASVGQGAALPSSLPFVLLPFALVLLLRNLSPPATRQASVVLLLAGGVLVALAMPALLDRADLVLAAI